MTIFVLNFIHSIIEYRILGYRLDCPPVFVFKSLGDPCKFGTLSLSIQGKFHVQVVVVEIFRIKCVIGFRDICIGNDTSKLFIEYSVVIC